MPHTKEPVDEQVELKESCGIVRELGDLPGGTVIDQDALARMFHRCSTSIQRSVERGELPPPVRLLGRSRWTVGFILEYLEARLRMETEKAKKEAARIARLGV